MNKPRIEEVVRSRPDLAGVQDICGTYLPNDKLGIGIVSGLRSDNEILVHWVASEVDTWMRLDEIELLDHDARVIAVFERMAARAGSSNAARWSPGQV